MSGRTKVLNPHVNAWCGHVGTTFAYFDSEAMSATTIVVRSTPGLPLRGSRVHFAVCK